MDCCCVRRICVARATHSQTHTGGVDGVLQHGYDMDPAAGELSLIAVGSDESAASLVVVRFGLVELLLGDQMLLVLPAQYDVIMNTDAEGAGRFFLQKLCFNSTYLWIFDEQNFVLLC